MCPIADWHSSNRSLSRLFLLWPRGENSQEISVWHQNVCLKNYHQAGDSVLDLTDNPPPLLSFPPIFFFPFPPRTGKHSRLRCRNPWRGGGEGEFWSKDTVCVGYRKGGGDIFSFLLFLRFLQPDQTWDQIFATTLFQQLRFCDKKG